MLYIASVLRKKWRSRRRLPSAAVSVEAVSDAAYVNIDHVVEVDSRDEEVKRSYRSVAEKDHRHQELWFNDN